MDESVQNLDTDTGLAKEDKRFVKITSHSLEQAKLQALKYFNIVDEQLLDFTILERGRKKFIFFGAQEITYSFSLKAIFKKLLLPFLIKIMKMANLNIFVEVSYREPNVKISFSGKDEKLMSRDNHELLYAFDHIIRLYLYHKVVVPKGTRISVNLVNGPVKNESERDLSEKQLVSLSEKIRDELSGIKKEHTTNPLSPSARRIVHQFFQDDPTVETQSLGQGRFKKVLIKKKS